MRGIPDETNIVVLL